MMSEYFNTLIDKINYILKSSTLTELEILKFQQYIDILSDDIFSYNEKMYYAIVIENDIHKYMDIVNIYLKTRKKR